MDNAFERARAAYGTGAYDDATLEFLFPQLKESEDEQVRKAMLQHFKNKTKEKWCNIPVKDIISWLEKQNHDGKKWITPAELNRLLTLRYEAGFDDGVRSEMKKQKEQKPAEWSEEDRMNLNSVLNHLKEYLTNDAYTYYERWLKSLRPSWKPSEEDIKMLEHIIGQYETGNKNSKVMGYLPRVEELSFLKNVLSKWKN